MKIIKGVVLIFSILIVGLSCTDEKENLTNEEARIICNKYEQLWDEGNFSIAKEILDSSYILYSPLFSEGIRGIDKLEEFIEGNSKTFSDFELSVDSLYVKDNIIFSYWTITGTNDGSLGELPATCEEINISGFAVSKVRDGKIYEEQTFWNMLGFYQQLGFQLIPPVAEVKG
ncbi:MAG: ester cyclase [Ignavibacteria bacterium]|nr:ester cyclase [Ignavibacteria bacterium]